MNAHSTVAAEAAAAGKQLAKGTGYNTLTRACSHLSLYHSETYWENIKTDFFEELAFLNIEWVIEAYETLKKNEER